MSADDTKACRNILSQKSECGQIVSVLKNTARLPDASLVVCQHSEPIVCE
jgi:hypothetical protein